MYGNNGIQLTTDAHLLASVAAAIDRDPHTGQDIRDIKQLLQMLIRDETFRVQTWLNPLSNDLSIRPAIVDETSWTTVVRVGWKVDPYLAVHLSERFTSLSMSKEIRRLIKANPQDVRKSPLAAQLLLGESLSPDLGFQLNVRSHRNHCLIVASPILGPCRPTNGNNLLLTVVRQQSIGLAIRNAVITKSLDFSDFFLCPSNCTSITIRPTRIR
jgi:hypothetical protein